MITTYNIVRFLPVLMLSVSCLTTAADRLQTPSVPNQRAEQALLLDIEATGNQLISVGESGTLLRAESVKTAWQQTDLPFSVMLTAVEFTDPLNGWIAGHDGLLAVTRDAGHSWEMQLQGDQINRLRLERLQQSEADLQLQLEAEPDNEELADQLESLSWLLEDAEAALDEGPSVPLLDLWFRDSEYGFAIGAYGLLLHTRDGGTSWQYWGDRLDNPDGVHLNSITSDHQGNLYIAAEAGNLFRSADQGESWETVPVDYDGSFFEITEFQQQLYLMGLRGHLFRSSDGLSWTEIESGTRATLNGSSATQNELVISGSAGVLLKTRDGERFAVVDTGSRSSYAAVVHSGDSLVLVGEGGVQVLEGQHE